MSLPTRVPLSNKRSFDSDDPEVLRAALCAATGLSSPEQLVDTWMVHAVANREIVK